MNTNVYYYIPAVPNVIRLIIISSKVFMASLSPFVARDNKSITSFRVLGSGSSLIHSSDLLANDDDIII